MDKGYHRSCLCLSVAVNIMLPQQCKTMSPTYLASYPCLLQAGHHDMHKVKIKIYTAPRVRDTKNEQELCRAHTPCAVCRHGVTVFYSCANHLQCKRLAQHVDLKTSWGRGDTARGKMSWSHVLQIHCFIPGLGRCSEILRCFAMILVSLNSITVLRYI